MAAGAVGLCSIDPEGAMDMFVAAGGGLVLVALAAAGFVVRARVAADFAADPRPRFYGPQLLVLAALSLMGLGTYGVLVAQPQPPWAVPAAVALWSLISAVPIGAGLGLIASRSLHTTPADPVRSLRLGRFIRPYRGTLTLGVVLTLALSVVELATPWPLVIIVDHAIGGDEVPAFLTGLDELSRVQLAGVAALASVVLVAFGSALRYLVEYLNGAVQARIGSDLRSEGFAGLQRAAVGFHDESRTGDLVSRLSVDTMRVEDMLMTWFETGLPDAITTVGMFAIMFTIDPQLALVALAVVPLLALWARRVHPALQRAERTARDKSGALADRATEVLQHVRAVQVFSREDEEGARFRESSEDAAASEIRARDLSARLGPWVEISLALGSAVVLYIGAIQVIEGVLTIGILLVVLTYLNRLYEPVSSISSLVATTAQGMASKDRLVDLFSADHLVAEVPNAVPVPDGPLTLALRDVHFAYPDGAPLLEDVSLDVTPGRRVCVVGATGAGKSTLLSLVMRLYDATEGTISIGGCDVRNVSLRSLRSAVALVPQDLWIMDGTIAENIAFGRHEATEEEVRAAGHMAMVDEFTDRLPRGYETVVGESGVLLSGGQRQRIALARAFLRGARVLLLDEPTSGLDVASEAQLLGILRTAGPGVAMLIVSHRLGIAKTADEIVVLDGGRVVERGTHLQLLGRRGRYADLWRAQHGARQTKSRKTHRTSWPNGRRRPVPAWEGGEFGAVRSS